MRNLDSGKAGGRLNWRQVRTLYLCELRSALRERIIVINSILIPILLYPAIMWVAFTGLMFLEGIKEKAVSRVAVQDWPDQHPDLRLKFERDRQIQLVPWTPATGTNDIKTGSVDALIEFLPPDDSAAALDRNFHARITFSRSIERSSAAQERAADLLNEYRAEWLTREAGRRGISTADWEGPVVELKNVASEKEMGGFLLGLVLPVLFGVMVAVGCFYPAVDSTAGERERHTWETLMSSAASRTSIVTAKYLYVATFGGVAGILNVAAMALTVKPIFAPMLKEAGIHISFTLSPAAVPFVFAAAALLAGFVAAAMMIFAAFARTFREGQTMIMPFYLLVIMPPMFLQIPGLAFSVPLAFIPVVNVTMMVRSALSNQFPLLPIAITLVMSVAMIAACIRLASVVLRFEDVMVGSYNGNLNRFIRERLLNQPPNKPFSPHE
ncbi:MAG TPA: ABC transporter permease [Verrucomicrobia bacterium]|nr:ABC transporter permease [Verrucomicrobiota bacterium]HOP96440.1 ABC transporter permease [Verrucomicrobiota bacterium]